MGNKNKNKAPGKKNPQQDLEKQIIREHARAFWGRLAWLVGSFTVAAIIGFEFKEVIQGLLTWQLADLSLMNLQPADDISSMIMVGLFTGAGVVIPLVSYHAYRFLEPVLNRSGSYLARLFFGSIALTIAGMTYAFSVTIPLGLHGMAAYGQDATLLDITTKSFLTFVIINSLVAILLFQLPLVIIFANSVRTFSKKAKVLMQAIGVPLVFIAAVASVPFALLGKDIMGIAMMVLPAIILFEIGMAWAMTHAKQKEVTTQTDKEEVAQFAENKEAETPVAPRPVQAAAYVAPTVQAAQVPVLAQESDSLTDMLDAMLLDDDEPAGSFHTETLPPSFDIATEEAVVEKIAPAPVARPTSPAVTVTAPISQAIRMPRTATPIKPAIAPAYRPVSSFDISARRPARPLAQPQPTPRRAASATPMTETISGPRISEPVPRNAPQPTIPFGLQSAQRGYAVEGLLAGHR